jgi:dihydroorotate dehydrogenase
MQLRGINFRPVYNASGAQGFFGEGYPYHRYWKYLGLTFEGCGFIAKTTTLEARAGNLPLNNNLTPQEWVPKCIIVNFWQGIVLNAVGLSGPGADSLLASRRWMERLSEPFFLSFMSVEDTAEQRLAELREFTALLLTRLPEFRSPVGLEINFSCPNAGLDPTSLINEVGQALEVAARLRIPLQPKFNATMPAEAVCQACQHEACDAITMSNTVPWGKLPNRINWQALFGTSTSPLAYLGGGGLSGWPLTPIVCDWIQEARGSGFTKPIWACGGIDSCQAVDQVKAAGASGIQLGTVAMLRPWRMKKLLRYANELFST